ncbi:DUF1307 domain-containing protein, partial [Escherichia sp. HC-CC]
IAGVEEKLTYTDTYAQENVTIDMEKVDFKALQGISGINVSAEDAKKGITMALNGSSVLAASSLVVAPIEAN